MYALGTTLATLLTVLMNTCASGTLLLCSGKMYVYPTTNGGVTALVLACDLPCALDVHVRYDNFIDYIIMCSCVPLVMI